MIVTKTVLRKRKIDVVCPACDADSICWVPENAKLGYFRCYKCATSITWEELPDDEEKS